MPNTHATLGGLFSDIADAIRAKTGSSENIKADDFPTEIGTIEAMQLTTGTEVTYDKKSHSKESSQSSFTYTHSITISDYAENGYKAVVAIGTYGYNGSTASVYESFVGYAVFTGDDLENMVKLDGSLTYNESTHKLMITRTTNRIYYISSTFYVVGLK